MSGPPLICGRCRNTSPPGTQYCPICGEPVDPQLVTTLRWLYTSLGDLDDRIARGEGGHTLTQLRDDYRERYLQVRATAPTAKQQTPSASPVSPVAAPTTAAPVWPTPVPAAPPVAPPVA